MKTSDNDIRGKRLYDLHHSILQLRSIYPPQIVVIEGGFGKYHNETHAIQNAVGVVLMAFPDIEPVVYMPKTIKATLLSGDASKAQLRKSIENEYPDIKFNNNDESDSFAIGTTYFDKNKIKKWDKNKHVLLLGLQKKVKKSKKKMEKSN